jgi:hypothetical protein
VIVDWGTVDVASLTSLDCVTEINLTVLGHEIETHAY